MVDRIMNPKHEVRIVVVGKYMKHRDSYKSVYESLDHAGIAHRARVLVVRVEAEEVSAAAPRPCSAAWMESSYRAASGWRNRGQDRGDPVRADQSDPLLRHLSGHAVRGHRVRPQHPRAG